MKKQITTPEELSQYIEKPLTIKNGDKEEVVTLVKVQEWDGEMCLSVRIRRKDIWDGIEPWYYFPFKNEYQIFVDG